MTNCGGECCGVTHVQRWKWDVPRFAYRARFARALLPRIADELPDYFTSQDIYWLIHRQRWDELDALGIPSWEHHKHCPTCRWDHYASEYLHTNGYIGLLKIHSGPKKGQFFLTDHAISWLTRNGWKAAAA